MNSQKYKIQALIAEIDEVLSKPAPRLPWTGSIDTVHQRHLLERVRTYLVSQDSKLPAGQQPASSQNPRPPQVRVPPPPPPPRAADRPSAAEQILLVVTGEIDHLRENLTQPLQEDIQALRQEQQALVQEIKQLEAVRQQQQSLAQQQANQQQIISEFMQALTGKLQETVASGLSQTLENLENQFLAGSAAPALGAASDSGTAGEYPVLTPAQRLEQMQQFQARADSLLMRLDSTMDIVFEALQGNLQSYQESLSQGLDRMHGLGQQSEAMFAAWVNHLAEQLGRETYSLAQRPIDLENRESATPRPIEPDSADPVLPNTARSHPATEPSIPEQVQEDRSSGEFAEAEIFPYAGTEISGQFTELRRDRDRTPTPSSLLDLEENLFGSEPLNPTAAAFPEAQTETALPGGSENAEDLYASLFASEEIAELELEPFVLENTETAAAIEPLQSQTSESPSTAEPLAAEDLFANVLAQDESLEDFLVGEDSEFTIANSVEELTLDTENLFPAPVAAIPQISEPQAQQQLDAGDREPAETLPNSGELSDTPAAVAESRSVPPPVLRTAPEISSTPQSAPPRVPSARDVQTGDFGSESHQLEEAYIQASPDENLLPVEESEDLEDRSLTLDNNTLQQLEADLYGLEGLENSVPGRSSALADSPNGGAENPFAAASEEEVGTLEDLFADVLEVSPSDEPFSLEEELDAELFAETEDPNLTLDEILASLTQPETTPIDALNQELATAGETEGRVEALPDRQKKKLISARSKATAADSAFAAIAPSFPDDRTPVAARPRPNSQWYLGIDFGTTGLSAALLDRASGQLYPICWQPKQLSETPQAEGAQPLASFRIPSTAVLEENTGVARQQVTVKSAAGGEFSQTNFKLPLKVGIPYLREAGGVYEPVFQESPSRAVSIALPLQNLRALLAALNPRKQAETSGEVPQAESSDPAMPPNFEGWPVPNLTCKASGLEPEVAAAALRDLRGVILGTPAGWSDAYRFNLREAVLGAGLVSSSAQIFAVEDAIATLLSAVTPVENVNLELSKAGAFIGGDRSAGSLALHASSFSGGTLIINAGAATVELALVDLPENIQDLTYADFTCQSFDFAGNAFDQDIICQLLAKNENFGMSLDLPRPGHPDLPNRYQLQQQLQSSAFGLQLLEAARHLKVILQHQESFVLEIERQRWEVKRRDLESQVLVPFVQQLNRELNAILSRVGMSAAGINQVICTGGMGSWPAIARWLRQKLPNAIVVQDSELEADLDVSPISNSGFQNTNFNLKTCRVACGLASLALYPQILDVPRQQYSDFFLLWELMQVLGSKTLSFEEILQLLQRAGVNTRNCEPRILAILEGNLPGGIVPAEADLTLLTAESRQNPDWQEILAEPLFFQEVDRGYRLNVEHSFILREYLGKIASGSQQKLLEPLTLAWDVRTSIYQ